MKEMVILTACAVLLGGCVSLPDPGVTRANAVILAAPHIKKALTAPIEDLAVEAQSGGASEALDLGLALLAGRRIPGGLDQKGDYARLTMINAKLMPQFTAYIKAHPGSNVFIVDWTKEFSIPAEDVAFITAYRQQFSPTYWISRAQRASSSTNMAIYQPPVRAGGGGTVLMVPISKPVLDATMIMTSAHCVHAAARSANPLNDGRVTLPSSIALMTGETTNEIVDRLQRDMIDQVPGPYFTGWEACGSREDFEHFSLMSKAGT